MSNKDIRKDGTKRSKKMIKDILLSYAVVIISMSGNFN